MHETANLNKVNDLLCLGVPFLFGGMLWSEHVSRAQIISLLNLRLKGVTVNQFSCSLQGTIMKHNNETLNSTYFLCLIPLLPWQLPLLLRVWLSLL